VIDVHAVAESRLSADGQRYTRNHRAVTEALDEAGRPLSLPELLRRRPDLVQSSAYRSLAILENAGVVHRLVTGSDFARFELAQELTEHHHHHRVCSACGSVEDFTLPADVETALGRALNRIARKASFAEVSHQLDLIGLCSNCR
jgi:Fur family transcriptional regulator, ferric uptake regulator